MNSPVTEPAPTLMNLKDAALSSGVPEEAIDHLMVLRIIKPVTTDPGDGPLFSVDQTVLLQILADMDTLNFRIEEMRDMVRVIDTLSVWPHSELAARYRVRLGSFAHSLSRRAVATEAQLNARARTAGLLGSRYPWLGT